MLQRPRVVAIIGELKTTGMAQHVWVDRESHLGSLADALDEAVETDGTDWPAALGNDVAYAAAMPWAQSRCSRSAMSCTRRVSEVAAGRKSA